MDRIISNTSAKNLEAILKINAFTYFISSEKGLAYFRFQNHLIANADKMRKDRVKSGSNQPVKWKPAKTLD